MAGSLGVAVVVLAACIYSDAGQHRPPGGEQRAGGANPASPTAPKSGAPNSRRAGAELYPVGATVVVATNGSRRIPTTVRYPAQDAGVGAAPLRTGSPYPLIVFSPGFDIELSAYSGLLDGWAAAGFVVAAPSYPLTNPTSPGGLDEADIVNHPADLHAVVDTLINAASRPSSLLSGLVDPARVGLAGHSDGGDVTDAVVADTCCRDPRVKAAIVLSGAELSSFAGAYTAAAGTALLVVQGSADTINLPACSEQIYDAAPPPRYYLNLIGAGHHAPYLSNGSYHAPPAQASGEQALVERVTTNFWRAYLRGSAAAREALAAQGTVASIGALTDETALPRQGTCPGAPP